MFDNLTNYDCIFSKFCHSYTLPFSCLYFDTLVSKNLLVYLNSWSSNMNRKFVSLVHNCIDDWLRDNVSVQDNPQNSDSYMFRWVFLVVFARTNRYIDWDKKSVRDLSFLERNSVLQVEKVFIRKNVRSRILFRHAEIKMHYLKLSIHYSTTRFKTVLFMLQTKQS